MRRPATRFSATCLSRRAATHSSVPVSPVPPGWAIRPIPTFPAPAGRCIAAVDHRRRRHRTRGSSRCAFHGGGDLYFLVGSNVALAMPFTLIGSLGGLALVLIASFGRKQDNPAIVLSYAPLRPVPRCHLVVVRQHAGPGHLRRGADHPGRPRRRRGVLRHARGLQGRRDPGHPEVHPVHGRGHGRRGGADARAAS